MGNRVRRRLKREETYLPILTADSHCCGTQHYKVTIFQFKKKFSSQLINRHYLKFKKKKKKVASTDQKHHHLEATGRCRILGPTPDRVDQNLHCSRSPSWFDAAWFSLTRSPPSTASSRASLPRLWGEENHSSRKRVAGKKLSTQSCILWQASSRPALKTTIMSYTELSDPLTLTCHARQIHMRGTALREYSGLQKISL